MVMRTLIRLLLTEVIQSPLFTETMTQYIIEMKCKTKKQSLYFRLKLDKNVKKTTALYLAVF